MPPGGSPLDVKCVVFNVATVYAIQDALFFGHPLTHRAVTITGGAVTRPRNLWVPIGTPLGHLLEEAGGLRGEHKPQGNGAVCIRCGKCVAACPMHLAPTFIRRALDEGDMARLARYHVEDCISCGCCSFICPAQIPLVETVARARTALEKGVGPR